MPIYIVPAVLDPTSVAILLFSMALAALIIYWGEKGAMSEKDLMIFFARCFLGGAIIGVIILCVML
jgi:hypothetical protein